MQPGDGRLKILRGNGAVVQLVDETRHGAGDGGDGFAGQSLEIGFCRGHIPGRDHALHVGQPGDGFVPRDGVRVQGLVGVLQLGGLGVRGVGRLAHGSDCLVHTCGDPAVAVHDAGVDTAVHLEEGVHKLLRQVVNLGFSTLRDQGARPVLRVLIQTFTLRVEQLVPQAGDIQRRHVPLGFLERVVQPGLLEEGRPRIGGLRNAFLPALGHKAGGRVHVVDDVGIGIVQPFQQLFSDLPDGSGIGDAVGVRDLLGRGGHSFMQVVELFLAVSQPGQHGDKAVGFLLRNGQILVDRAGVEGGDGLGGIRDRCLYALRILQKDLAQKGEVVVGGFRQGVVSRDEFVDDRHQIAELVGGFHGQRL